MKRKFLFLFVLLAAVVMAGCPRPTEDVAVVDDHQCRNSCPYGWTQNAYPDCACKNPGPVR